MSDLFFIDTDAMPRFAKGKIVDDVDRHGKPIRGEVEDVRDGNKVALVTVKTGGSNG